MTDLLCSLGHVATWKVLSGRGMTRRALSVLIGSGRVQLARRGVYACAHLDQLTRRAIAAGGALTCVSALRAAGVWAGMDQRVHVQVPAHGSLSAPPGVVFHWSEPRFEVERWRVTSLQSLWQAIHCLDDEHAIAAMESAVHEGYLTETDVRRIAVAAPRRLDDGLRRLDFRSQSGNETVVRLRVQRAGYPCEPQAFLPGMGHRDLLVAGCVSLDVDGRRWHGQDRFALDRDRDIRVEGFGQRALRIWAGQIYQTWPSTLAAIERAVTDARREVTRRDGRVIVRATDPLE